MPHDTRYQWDSDRNHSKMLCLHICCNIVFRLSQLRFIFYLFPQLLLLGWGAFAQISQLCLLKTIQDNLSRALPLTRPAPPSPREPLSFSLRHFQEALVPQTQPRTRQLQRPNGERPSPLWRIPRKLPQSGCKRRGDGPEASASGMRTTASHPPTPACKST